MISCLCGPIFWVETKKLEYAYTFDKNTLIGTGYLGIQGNYENLGMIHSLESKGFGSRVEWTQIRICNLRRKKSWSVTNRKEKSNPDPTVKKKLDPDPILELHPGSGYDLRKFTFNVFCNIKVNVIEMYFLNYKFGIEKKVRFKLYSRGILNLDILTESGSKTPGSETLIRIAFWWDSLSQRE